MSLWKRAFLSFLVVFSDDHNTWYTQRKQKASVCWLDQFYPTFGWLDRSMAGGRTCALIDISSSSRCTGVKCFNVIADLIRINIFPSREMKYKREDLIFTSGSEHDASQGPVQHCPRLVQVCKMHYIVQAIFWVVKIILVLPRESQLGIFFCNRFFALKTLV